MYFCCSDMLEVSRMDVKGVDRMAIGINEKLNENTTTSTADLSGLWERLDTEK